MAKQTWPLAAFTITRTDGTKRHITIQGRDRWALESLLRAGRDGCTPIDTPAPRWASYVFSLREAGGETETVTEKHKGDFLGHHARYVLKSRVTQAAGGDA